MSFKVGDAIIAQRKGGRSGIKNESREFHGTVIAVNGTKYTIKWAPGADSTLAPNFFHGDVVDAQHMKLKHI